MDTTTELGLREAAEVIGGGNMPRRYILTIDGGGMRGIIPACALVALERQTGMLARETFSFVGGTSTGAVIASGIAAGVPAERILDLYLKRGVEIFPRRPWNILKRIALGRMYSTETLRTVIAEELGDSRGWTLNDAPIDLLITAKRIRDGEPWYFVRDRGENAGRTGSLRLLDCVIASTAAPTHFAPWTMPETTIPPGEEPIGTLVDGGVGVAGNPVYQSCVEAFHYTDAYIPSETTVVSLGTGNYADWEKPRWIWPWVRWLLSELLRSPGEQQTELVQRHFDEATFYRIDAELKRDIPLDDPRAAPELLEYGLRLADRIDWSAILAGEETPFTINAGKTRGAQYRVAVA
jgi:uncharacterized protein